MVDHREYKAAGEGPAGQSRAEGAEQKTRVLWVIGFAVLAVAGLIFAFAR
jgi:hypothetical protein